jgi:hypothetical protein
MVFQNPKHFCGGCDFFYFGKKNGKHNIVPIMDGLLHGDYLI